MVAALFIGSVYTPWRGFRESMFKTFITPAPILFVIVGCASQQELQTHEAFFSIEVTNDVPGGYATFLTHDSQGQPMLLVKPTHYPTCVTHEIRHVFEGEWHGTDPTVCHGRRQGDDLTRLHSMTEKSQSQPRTSP